MQHDNVLKKFNFNLLTPGPRGGLQGKYLLQMAAFVIPFKLICNMTVFEKVNFDILTPPPGSGGGRRGSAGKICATTFPHS